MKVGGIESVLGYVDSRALERIIKGVFGVLSGPNTGNTGSPEGMRKADRRLGNQKPKQQNERCVRIDGDDVVGGCREQAAIQSWLLSKLLPSPVRKGKRNQPMQALQNGEPALTTIIGKGQPSGGEVPHLPLGRDWPESLQFSDPDTRRVHQA